MWSFFNCALHIQNAFNFEGRIKLIGRYIPIRREQVGETIRYGARLHHEDVQVAIFFFRHHPVRGRICMVKYECDAGYIATFESA
jgi:hypothetical protein